MKWIKAFTYNFNIEERVLIGCYIVAVIVWCFTENKYLFALSSLLLLVLIPLMRKYNRNKYKTLKYFCVNQGFLFPKYACINQCVSKKRDEVQCPRLEFIKDMKEILKVLPKGAVCYCCTHELIVKHIKKKFPNAECTPVYKKDLKRLKKEIKSAYCKNCNDENCPLTKSEVVQFYAVKFTI